MSKYVFDKAELYDTMLFTPLYWFDVDGVVVAAFADIDDAWRWACVHPEQICHPCYFGSSLSGNNGRPAGDLIRLGFDWFKGWCVGKALAAVK